MCSDSGFKSLYTKGYYANMKGYTIYMPDGKLDYSQLSLSGGADNYRSSSLRRCLLPSRNPLGIVGIIGKLPHRAGDLLQIPGGIVRCNASCRDNLIFLPKD